MSLCKVCVVLKLSVQFLNVAHHVCVISELYQHAGYSALQQMPLLQ